MLTTTIGAYPKPAQVPIKDWFQRADGTDTSEPTAGYAETVRQYGARLEAILDAATVEVVRAQDALGIDVPTDGEIRRENYIHYHCRHLVGIDFATLTEKQMRGHYQALLPTITGPIQASRQPFLVRDWQIAQSATRKPVKITVPGPLTIGDSVADDFYRDPRTRGAALADALNVEIRRLADAGCPVIQIDEPVFARRAWTRWPSASSTSSAASTRCRARSSAWCTSAAAIPTSWMPRTTRRRPRRRTSPWRAGSTRSRSMRSRSRTRTGRTTSLCSRGSRGRRSSSA